MKKPGPRLSPAERTALLGRAFSGESNSSIARQFGVSQQYVSGIRKQQGILVPSEGAPKGNRRWIEGKLVHNPCVLCGYPFGEMHHVVSCSKVGRRSKVGRISLCPNHHQQANHVQRMVAQGCTESEIMEFAREWFDEQFCELILEHLGVQEMSAEKLQ